MRTTAFLTVLVLILGACGAGELSTTDGLGTGPAGQSPNTPVPPDELAPDGDLLTSLLVTATRRASTWDARASSASPKGRRKKLLETP